VDVEASHAEGSVMLKPALATSTYDVCFKVKIGDAVIREHPKLEGVMLFATAVVRKDTAGFLNIPLTGSFSGRPKARRGLCKGANNP